MASDSSWTMVDTPDTVMDMIDVLRDSNEQTPDIFLDLEGENLSRTGTLSILQILYLPKAHVYLVDCLKLGKQAFEESSGQNSLRTILESGKIKKAIFDVRNDSAALYHQYGISLAGVEDIQLMELAIRQGNRQFVSGLAKCIQFLPLSFSDRCLELKKQGHKLFDPALGGSYAVFAKRPLRKEILHYCVQDVCILPVVWNSFSKKLNSSWRNWVHSESARRIEATKSVNFNGKGRHLALAPTSWKGVSKCTPTPVLVLEELYVAQCLNVMSREFETEDALLQESGSSDISVDDLAQSFSRHRIEDVLRPRTP